MSDDAINCIKNLLQVLCCDGKIEIREKEFLSRAAKSLKVEVPDWNALLKQVAKDGQNIYPIANLDKATATLKAMALMAQADKTVTDEEKKLLQAFAKSIGLTKDKWKQVLSELDMSKVFDVFEEQIGRIAVLKEDFEKIAEFDKIAKENNAQTRTLTFTEYLKGPALPGEMVCFHAAEDKTVTLQRTSALLKKAGTCVVCVLTRFQGFQVKYLHETGLERCIIEPVYAKDIAGLFKLG